MFNKFKFFYNLNYVLFDDSNLFEVDEIFIKL